MKMTAQMRAVTTFFRLMESNKKGFGGSRRGKILDKLMGFNELIMPNTVNTTASDNKIIANIQLCGRSHAVFIGIHPFINTCCNTSVIEFLSYLDAVPILSRGGYQKEIFFHVCEHIRKHFFIFFIGNGAQNGAQGNQTFSGIGANDFYIFGILHFAELPAVTVRSVRHKNFASNDAENRLENRFIINVARGLLLSCHALAEHHSQYTKVGPLGKNDVLKLQLCAGDLLAKLQNPFCAFFFAESFCCHLLYLHVFKKIGFH